MFMINFITSKHDHFTGNAAELEETNGWNYSADPLVSIGRGVIKASLFLAEPDTMPDEKTHKPQQAAYKLLVSLSGDHTILYVADLPAALELLAQCTAISAAQEG
jgi:hypothetical protein